MDTTVILPFYRASPSLGIRAQKSTSHTIENVTAGAQISLEVQATASYTVSTHEQILRKRRKDFRDVQQYIDHRTRNSERYNPYTLFL